MKGITMSSIRVSHAGSLPRTEQLIAANAGRFDNNFNNDEFQRLLQDSVVDLVAKQKELGITDVNDGEYGHAMAAAKDYSAWWHYSFERTGGGWNCATWTFSALNQFVQNPATFSSPVSLTVATVTCFQGCTQMEQRVLTLEHSLSFPQQRDP